MIDTHAHIQFKAFEGRVDEVITSANQAGVKKIVVVGTNLETSRKAIELAEKYAGLYASAGIHPHHIFGIINNGSGVLEELENLLSSPKVIAIGETGLDFHIYQNTKYQDYKITDQFINSQKLFFKEQIKLAIKYQKTLIIHNRQAVPELLQTLEENWDPFLEGRSVFHCFEPDQRLLNFALKHKVFIGIDGDITYDQEKQKFLKQIPLNLLVLETDSPYFLPEPLRLSEGGNPINNEPKNLTLIAKFISEFLNLSFKELQETTSKNSQSLFNLPEI